MPGSIQNEANKHVGLWIVTFLGTGVMDLYCCLWDAWIQQLNVLNHRTILHLAWSLICMYIYIYNIYIYYIQLPFIIFQYGKVEQKGS